MMIMRELTGGLYFGERKTVEENGSNTILWPYTTAIFSRTFFASRTISGPMPSPGIHVICIGGDTTKSPWYKLPPNLRPEAGLLAIRKALNLFGRSAGYFLTIITDSRININKML